MRGRTMLKIYVYVLWFVMLAPIAITFPVAVTNTAYMTFPPIGFTLNWFKECFRDQILAETLIRSLELAALSATSAVVIALLSSFAFVRKNFPGKNLVEALFTGPRVVPLIILVLGMLLFYHSIGLAETFWGLVFSHLVITIPFAFRTLLASVSSLDIQLEWSARILGANWLTMFFRVIAPRIKTGLIAAFMFTFITSFNNVTMALFLSAPGERTLPVELFMRLQVGGISPKVPAFSFILALVGLMLLIVLDKTVGIYKYLAGEE